MTSQAHVVFRDKDKSSLFLLHFVKQFFEVLNLNSQWLRIISARVSSDQAWLQTLSDIDSDRCRHRHCCCNRHNIRPSCYRLLHRGYQSRFCSSNCTSDFIWWCYSCRKYICSIAKLGSNRSIGWNIGSCSTACWSRSGSWNLCYYKAYQMMTGLATWADEIHQSAGNTLHAQFWKTYSTSAGQAWTL